MFLATFESGTFMLTCDGLGNILSGNTILLTITGMVDFTALNVFNKCLIQPILSSFSSVNPIYIWDGTSTPRPAAGNPPGTGGGFGGAESSLGTGWIDVGIHKYAVSFITSTGFTTPPGPCDVMNVGPSGAGPAQASNPGTFSPVSVNSTGNNKVTLTGIPIGPTGTVARQILCTQADQNLFYFAPGGFIGDNVTTTVELNFYDTDLAVSADLLFDLLTSLPGAEFQGGMAKYHGRTFIIGENDLVRASNPGDCESFSNVDGYIQLPSENDGNFVRGACVLQDLLYFTKGVGIFSVTDNAGSPSGWPIVITDGGCGSFYFGIETISSSQASLSTAQTILLSDGGGLYAFNGVVQRPALTWKIDDFWKSIGLGNLPYVNVVLDPFQLVFYVFIGAGPLTGTLLVGDYTEGLNEQQIKWSIYSFTGIVPTAIGIANFNDTIDFNYYFRVGTAAQGMFKLVPDLTHDHNAFLNIAINSYYSTFYATVSPGALTLFRHVRMRVLGEGSMSLQIFSEDKTLNYAAPNPWTLVPSPGKDYDMPINFFNEKGTLYFGTNAVDEFFTAQRVDLFSSVQNQMRPL